MSDHDRSFARPVVVAAIAVMIVATVGGPVLFARGMDLRPIFALAVPFLAVSTVGWWWCERRGRAALRVMLIAQVALAVALVWVSDQNLFLLVLPPLLVVVLYEGVWWGTATVVAVVGIAALQNAQAGVGLEQIYLRSTGFVPGAIVAIAFAHVMVRERRAQEELAELAAVRERNRIARDIHDNLAQGFGAILMQLQAAQRAGAVLPPAVERSIDTAIELARTHMVEARRSVGALRPNVSGSEDVARAIRRVAELAQKTSDIPIDVHIDDLPRFGDGVEREVIGIAQEALTNAVRHARARRITIRAATVNALGLRLSIADDGRGIPRERQSSGFGMTSMQERAERIGASLTIVTAPRSGTEVVLAWEPGLLPTQIHAFN